MGLKNVVRLLLVLQPLTGHSEYSDASSDSFAAEKPFGPADWSVHCRAGCFKFRWFDLGNIWVAVGWRSLLCIVAKYVKFLFFAVFSGKTLLALLVSSLQSVQSLDRNLPGWRFQKSPWGHPSAINLLVWLFRVFIHVNSALCQQHGNYLYSACVNISAPSF